MTKHLLVKANERTAGVFFASCIVLALALLLGGCATSKEEPSQAQSNTSTQAAVDDEAIADVVKHMALEDKIAQMVIVSFRTWDDVSKSEDRTNLTNLEEAPELAKALAKHPYGGIILYSQNVVDANQTARLVCDLQTNNAHATLLGDDAHHIPYFTTVDEEGGIVQRLTDGTRMCGNMAICATGDNARENAERTGAVLGEECAAVGVNVDFAPDIDVNSNPMNPVIGTRSFSDDPEAVAPLGSAVVRGLANSGVIATYKHFPGHGDTSEDSHSDFPSVRKSRDELMACELVPFKAIAGDADMIMTAHVSLPEVDGEQSLSGSCYPATMSKDIVTGILRDELGYNGVVVTDALEMDAIAKGRLVPGAEGSAEYAANVAERVIQAGADILLMPRDLIDPDAAAFYDEYLNLVADKARKDSALAARIDESVGRILTLKKKYGIFDAQVTDPVFSTDKKASDVVGSAAHHEVEADIAHQAITVVKNDDALPLSGSGTNVVLLGRFPKDNMTLAYAVRSLQEQGVIDADAYVENLVAGTTDGSPSADTHITIDYYCDADTAQAHYTDDLEKAIEDADVVVCCTASASTTPLAASSPLYKSVSRAMEQIHGVGGQFVLLANNLPYDAARYQDADAIMLSYMSAGLDVDPAQEDVAYNANVLAAIDTLFGAASPKGKLPVSIPKVKENADGTISYTDETLYERGWGIEW